jgi:GNAT superfamily N-acetyltransferase
MARVVGGDVAIVVREIRDGDVERLAAVTLDAYVALDGIDVGEYRTTLADVADRAKRAVVLVAEADDAVLGGVTYVPDASNPYAEFTDADGAGMRMLAVAPAAQGHGVGAALVRACVERARGTGRRRLVLHTTEAMVAARRLYERFGFVRVPRRDWRPQPHILLLGYERVLEQRTVGA